MVKRLANLVRHGLLRLFADPGAVLSDVERYILRSHHPYRQPAFSPLNLKTDPSLSTPANLNVLLPGLAMRAMSGGPNTVINLTYRLAARGVPVRYIATELPPEADTGYLWEHIRGLTGIQERFPHVVFASATDPSRPLAIGKHDVFFATMWSTAHLAKQAMRLTEPGRFIYFIQDFEPGLYPWSSEYALALETYRLDFRAIISGRMLARYLTENRIGRFAEPGFMDQCAVLDWAIDESLFHFDRAAHPDGTKTLLFYARPNLAKRNLFELGMTALERAVEEGVFADEKWEFRFMGEKLAPVDLGHGLRITQAPWRNFEGYAEMLRGSDVLLSLMLSPHPSYPPLEFAACGGLAVTNTYDVKSAAALREISGNIVSAEPTVEGIAAGLREAVARTGDWSAREAHSAIRMPRTWEESFRDLLPRVQAMWEDCLRSAQS